MLPLFFIKLVPKGRVYFFRPSRDCAHKTQVYICDNSPRAATVARYFFNEPNCKKRHFVEIQHFKQKWRLKFPTFVVLTCSQGAALYYIYKNPGQNIPQITK